MSEFEKARELVRGFKGDDYAFGSGALQRTGSLAAQLGQRVAVVFSQVPGKATNAAAAQVKESLQAAGLTLLSTVAGVTPNAPREQVLRLGEEIEELGPDVIVVIGGGSTIDAAKAANILAILGGPIDRYFGTALVTGALAEANGALIPLLAVQTASSSSAHLTKYSNITDLSTGQKKLIVDEAIVPPKAAFQYDVTTSMPPDLTADGGLDGISHMIEVLYSAVGTPDYNLTEGIAAVGVKLIVDNLLRAVKEPTNLRAREALGLGTDLGGYAIMIGGTNGGHLTSFSLVDVMSHGRACAVANPYWTVFFAPAIQQPLKLLGRIYRDAGWTDADIDSLDGRELGIAVAEAMIALLERIGLPASLGEVGGFSGEHIERALTAAKNPQLKMKLQNMPVPLTAEMVDDYMGPVLEAARTADLSLIKNVKQG